MVTNTFQEVCLACKDVKSLQDTETTHLSTWSQNPPAMSLCPTGWREQLMAVACSIAVPAAKSSEAGYVRGNLCPVSVEPPPTKNEFVAVGETPPNCFCHWTFVCPLEPASRTALIGGAAKKRALFRLFLSTLFGIKIPLN